VRLPLPAILVITDRHQTRRSLEDTAVALFAGGCRWLSLREKDLAPADRCALLLRLIKLGTPWGARIMVHDDASAALASGAAGVHLPAGASVAEARRMLGPSAFIGQSAHHGDDIVRAAEEGADYATLSPIFVTASKPGYGPALGLSPFAKSWPIPVLALGGIDETNIAALLAAGAAGAAVMGSAMRAADPQVFMARLLVEGRLVAAGRSGAHVDPT
jgi:thiamine-phosphate pyrophosphorylase